MLKKLEIDAKDIEDIEDSEDSEEEFDVEILFEIEIQQIKNLLYDQTNKKILKKLPSLLESLKNSLLSKNLYQENEKLYFFKDEMEEYCFSDYKFDENKVNVIKLLLQYVPFDIYYIQIASNFKEKLGKLDDDYIEEDEVANEVLSTLISYSIHLFKDNKLSKQDCNTILYSLINNEKYDQCAKCISIFEFEMNDKDLFNKIWTFGNVDCIKKLVQKYFILKDEFKHFN